MSYFEVKMHQIPLLLELRREPAGFLQLSPEPWIYGAIFVCW